MRSINQRSSNLQTLDLATDDWYVYRGQVKHIHVGPASFYLLPTLVHESFSDIKLSLIVGATREHHAAR